MIEQLIEKLHSPDPYEKRNALESLYDSVGGTPGKSAAYREGACDPGALEAAAYLLTDTDRGVREAASRLLVLCSSEKSASLTAAHILSTNISVRNLAGDTLVRMSKAAVPALIPYIDSADKDVRKFAIDLLAQLPASQEALQRIAVHLSDPDENIICASIDAIGDLRAESYLDQVMALFEKEEYARPNIVNALAKFPDKIQLQYFENALSDRDPVVQLAAAEALAAQKNGDVMTVLLRKLDQVSDLAKPVLLHSLIVLLESDDFRGDIPSGEFSPQSLKEYLIKMLDDTDPAYVRAAVRGLRHFFDKNVLEILISHLGKSESVDNAISLILKDHIDEVFSIILKSGDRKENITPIVKMIISLIQNIAEKGNHDIYFKKIEDMFDFISKGFMDIDVDTKISALTVCDSIGLPSAVKLVKAALGDEEFAVKSYALDLAAKIGPQSFAEELGKLAEDYNEEISVAAATMLTGIKPGYQNQD
ncbi:MAG: HEAT repeat domain-containing protein [Candidatus Kryptoniota bacterium]